MDQTAPIFVFRDIDLLTVVMHEIGHIFGLGDVPASEQPDDLMADTLLPGTRRGLTAPQSLLTLDGQPQGQEKTAPALDRAKENLQQSGPTASRPPLLSPALADSAFSKYFSPELPKGKRAPRMPAACGPDGLTEAHSRAWEDFGRT